MILLYDIQKYVSKRPMLPRFTVVM